MSGWASRPLGDAGRRRTFAAVAVVLGASALALALGVGPQERREPQRASAGEGPAVIASPVTTTTATTVATPTPAAASPPVAPVLRAARAFLRGYLRFEVGDGAAAVRRAVRRTGTGAFARVLLANPPRTDGARPRAGRLDGLELADDATVEDMTVVATIARGDTVTPLTVRLERTGDGWRVGGLG